MAIGAGSNITLPTVKPCDAIMIQYTSAATGFPKGALLNHRGLVDNSGHLTELIGATEGSVYLTAAPLFQTDGCTTAALDSLSKKTHPDSG